jgi:hypothetical protein
MPLSASANLSEALLALAEAEAATPEGRARMVRLLCRTAEAVGGRPLCAALACAVGAQVVEGLADLAGQLVLLGDHAEWLADQARLMPPPPQGPPA